MYPQIDSKSKHDPIAMVANISGIASFILAIAGNNVEKLSILQKYGLAIASAVMIWTFTAGLLIRYMRQLMDDHRSGAAVGAMFFGGWIGAGLILAALPLFGFGLSSTQVDTISLIGAGLFAAVFTLAACFGIYANVTSSGEE